MATTPDVLRRGPGYEPIRMHRVPNHEGVKRLRERDYLAIPDSPLGGGVSHVQPCWQRC
jgi:hypothetical protein